MVAQQVQDIWVLRQEVVSRDSKVRAQGVLTFEQINALETSMQKLRAENALLQQRLELLLEKESRSSQQLGELRMWNTRLMKMRNTIIATIAPDLGAKAGSPRKDSTASNK